MQDNYFFIERDPQPFEDGGMEPGVTLPPQTFIYTLYQGFWSTGMLVTYKDHHYEVYKKYLVDLDSGAIWFVRVGDGTIRLVQLDDDGKRPPSVRSRHKAPPNTRKLDRAQVDDIRRLSVQGMTAKDLAKQFGVSKTQVFRIIHGHAWLDPDAQLTPTRNYTERKTSHVREMA